MFKIIFTARSINVFLIVFVWTQLVSCSGSSRTAMEKLIIEMEKTGCYGQCPVYTVKIDENGRGLFIGVENTPHLGLFSFRLRVEELEGLTATFERIGFFELEDRYYDYVTDLPTTYLTYRSGSREKKVMDYYGAPKELKDLEKSIADLVLSKRMRKVR
jgi:hypothetical protein